MERKYGSANFKVISINVDHDERLAHEFLLKNPASFTILYDLTNSLVTEMKLKGMPSSFLIDTKGYVVSTHVVFTEKKKSLYEQEIKHLLINNDND